MKHLYDFKTRLPKLIMQSILTFLAAASGLMLNYTLHIPITTITIIIIIIIIIIILLTAIGLSPGGSGYFTCI
jgi:hypothetical protein